MDVQIFIRELNKIFEKQTERLLKKLKNQNTALLFFFVLPFTAALIGSVFTAPNIKGWYSLLNKPFFTPPSWIFAPVWTTLYFLMGLSAFLVWKEWKSRKILKKTRQVAEAYNWFFLQLILNTAWSVSFFGFKQLFLSILIIILLLISVLMNIKTFYKQNKVSAYLLIPYSIWGSFATILNISVWLIN